MPSQTFANVGPARARGVVVLLPGFGDRPEAFDDNGFVRILRERAPAHDVVAADAHFGYYRNGSVVDELHAHVVGPLMARGYRELWLAGVSMGGHGAVAYARAHPEHVTGLLLLAPYMGPKDVVAAVANAGGLCNWSPPAEFAKNAEGFALANFAWLEQVGCRSHDVALWVGVGQDDGLFPADRLLGDVVPSDHFVRLPGGHDWKVWTPALEKMLGQGLRR